ncbi:MAG: alanine racemase [Lachnospiraceae bacterium]|nr:alanine racemase [Lachnospiraceae bacterium]
MGKQITFQQIMDNTPAFMFDETVLTDRVTDIRKILGDIRLCYSIKANPFLIPTVLPLVDYLEVCSPGELMICKDQKVPGNKIIYSGVHKDAADIEEAIVYGAAILTAESIRHFHLINEMAEKTGKKVNVILRLTSGNQFGMSIEDIESILKEKTSNITIRGLHYFAGTGRRSAKKKQAELDKLTTVMNDLEKRSGCSLPMLEYGPGLPHPYFIDEDFSDTLLPLREIREDLRKVSKERTLSVEMGRFIASSCGYYMTQICDIKKSADVNWIIVDGGINHVNYLGQMVGMKIPVIKQMRNGKFVDAPGEGGKKYTICGSLCTVNDVLVRELPLNDPAIGDILMFCNIGAYSVTEAPALFLSRDIPSVLMYDGRSMCEVRSRMGSWIINTTDN